MGRVEEYILEKPSQGKMEEYILEELLKNIGVGDFQLPMFFDKPIHIGDETHKAVRKQGQLINIFFDSVVSLARESLNNNVSEINDILFSESISGMDLAFHRSLPDCCWSKPIFCRTDQSISGQIFEIQSPGSGWGDIPLYAKSLHRLGYSLPDFVSDYCNNYAQNIISVTENKESKVYHMLDAASAPVGMRYLFTQTRPMLKYWGLDKDVSMHDVDYVTAHSAASLVTSNYFDKYLSCARNGKLIFGIAPNLLFDQKAIYLLPFYRKTAHYFSDEIRRLFPFTTCIEGEGFYDLDGSFVLIKDFEKRPKSNRRYFLKYGGPDLSRNWGSRSVFRLSGSDCSRLLLKAKRLSDKGEIWLIQEDLSHDNAASISKDIKSIIHKGYHIKLSAFHGMNRLLGIKIMARKHFKVHGQSSTYAGLCF